MRLRQYNAGRIRRDGTTEVATVEFSESTCQVKCDRPLRGPSFKIFNQRLEFRFECWAAFGAAFVG